MHYNNWNEGVGGLEQSWTCWTPSEEKVFEHCKHSYNIQIWENETLIIADY